MTALRQLSTVRDNVPLTLAGKAICHWDSAEYFFLYLLSFTVFGENVGFSWTLGKLATMRRPDGIE